MSSILILHGSLHQLQTAPILTAVGATKQQENSSRALKGSPALLCKVYSALIIVTGPSWRWSSCMNWHGYITTWFKRATSGTTEIPNWWGMSHCSECASNPRKEAYQHPAWCHERPSWMFPCSSAPTSKSTGEHAAVTPAQTRMEFVWSVLDISLAFWKLVLVENRSHGG